MKLKSKTIEHLAVIICGNKLPTMYRTGPALVNLFSNYGFKDTYGAGFPSRHLYAEEKLRLLNGKSSLKDLIEEVLNPIHFMEPNYELGKIVDQLNSYLRFDGHVVEIRDTSVVVSSIAAKTVEFELERHSITELNLVFIQTQISKCSKKLSEEDFDGAITNARSLAESVCLEIVNSFEDGKYQHDGDLIKVFRKAQQHLNMTPGNESISQTLKQILSGLSSIVNGLASLRNKMGDAHAQTYKPARHHALLAINSSKTLCEFLFDSWEYQTKRKT